MKDLNVLVELCADVLCPWGRGKARELPRLFWGWFGLFSAENEFAGGTVWCR